VRKFDNRQEVTSIYKRISDKIKKRYSAHDISENDIINYLSKNSNRFIESNSLDEISSKVFKDILNHKKNRVMDMKKKKKNDSILNFNNFTSINESFFEIEKPTIEHEKVLADLFNTSVGHVEIVDEENHIYSVTDFQIREMVCILSEKDFEKVKSNILMKLIEEISAKSLVIEEVDNVKFDVQFMLDIKDIFDKSKLESCSKKFLIDTNVVALVTNNLRDTLVFVHDYSDVEFVKNVSGFFVWKFV
jgi:hypothetical protein